MLPCEAPASFAEGGLVLRALEADDWQVEQNLSRCPDVARWTTLPADLDEEAARRRVTRGVELRADGKVARYVVLDADGVALGVCGMSGVPDRPGVVEVFYALLPAGRGRGAATAAASLLARWARDNGARQVGLKTFEDNLASQRVARRAGFSRDGVELQTVKGVEVVLVAWRLD